MILSVFISLQSKNKCLKVSIKDFNTENKFKKMLYILFMQFVMANVLIDNL